MLSSTNAVMFSRVLVPFLCLVVWGLFYLNARCAYRLPKSRKKTASQLVFVFGAVGIFVLQVNLMDSFAAADAYGSYFQNFILIECGGALVVLFYTLVRERARNRKIEPGESNSQTL